MCIRDRYWTMKILGPILALLATTLISFCILVWYFAILPQYIDTSVWSSRLFIEYTVAIFISFNIFFNYFAVIMVDPGSLSKDYSSLQETGSMIVMKKCKKCNAPKPPRAHHCFVCRKCVFKMDHHCPWMMNCVGLRNHRYFILFLVYLWIGCFYLTAVSAPIFYYSDKTQLQVSVFLTLVFAGVFTFVLLMFAGWQIYLVLTGQTQFEFYENHQASKQMRMRGKTFVNEYDLGMQQNFNVFFGTESPWWTFAWLLPSFKVPNGDGINFPTIRSQ
eukprot:TRINITY_DN85_c0_g1_i4.p1 TRINITY_DN85_c0_g1~~TRINITY_DN85_c0_g1_i4.p1  ORF type:complete len:275 (-),score=38.32 TRINITY_DN85_c0_g1_i4:13-837(-)